MIEPTRPQLAWSRGRSCPVAPALVAILAAPVGAAARPAPRPAPRRVAGDLDALVCDGALLRDPAPERAARRAFTAGDGFLPGQLIDRAI